MDKLQFLVLIIITAEQTNMVIAGFGDRRDLARNDEVFIEYEAEVLSRVSGVNVELLILASCSLRPVSRNSVLEEFSVCGNVQ